MMRTIKAKRAFLMTPPDGCESREEYGDISRLTWKLNLVNDFTDTSLGIASVWSP
jgi:hypothetical protein